MKEATLFCDGGARGNPGPAAAGAVLVHQSKLVEERGRFLGETTNNVAEYHGLLLGLQMAREQAIQNLHVRLDSELVVKQLRGEYKVKHPALKPLWEKVKVALTHFHAWDIAHVPRAQNREADRKVNEVLDQRL